MSDKFLKTLLCTKSFSNETHEKVYLKSRVINGIVNSKFTGIANHIFCSN